jgi:hypothetical protein
VADVEEVEAEFAGQDNTQVVVEEAVGAEELFFAAIEDGGGAGDAGADGQEFPAGFSGPGFDEVGIFRTGSNETHIAFEYVPQLGQFIEFCVAQPVADGSDAVVGLGGYFGAVVAFGPFLHGAEF